MQERLPRPVTRFKKDFPNIWEAFNELGEECHNSSPLDEKTRRLVAPTPPLLVGGRRGEGEEGAESPRTSGVNELHT